MSDGALLEVAVPAVELLGLPSHPPMEPKRPLPVLGPKKELLDLSMIELLGCDVPVLALADCCLLAPEEVEPLAFEALSAAALAPAELDFAPSPKDELPHPARLAPELKPPKLKDLPELEELPAEPDDEEALPAEARPAKARPPTRPPLRAASA